MLTQQYINQIIDTTNIKIIKKNTCFYVETETWRSSRTFINCVTISETQKWRNIYYSLRFKTPPAYLESKVVYIKGFPLVRI